MPAPAPRAARSNPIVYLIISNFLVQTRPGTPAWPAAAPRATCSRARARDSVHDGTKHMSRVRAACVARVHAPPLASFGCGVGGILARGVGVGRAAGVAEMWLRRAWARRRGGQGSNVVDALGAPGLGPRGGGGSREEGRVRAGGVGSESLCAYVCMRACVHEHMRAWPSDRGYSGGRASGGGEEGVLGSSICARQRGRSEAAETKSQAQDRYNGIALWFAIHLRLRSERVSSRIFGQW